ncbi:MAG: hypothetical protein ACREJY_14550 [Candidatus Rokuibacteriota bacterium]
MASWQARFQSGAFSERSTGLENLSAVTADIRGEIATIGEELAAILGRARP